jgi:hypothetical protein
MENARSSKARSKGAWPNSVDGSMTDTTATPATDALAAESISLAVWALDASKAVEKEPEPIPEPHPRRHGHRWLLRTIVFVGAACATFLALAPRPAFASVVAPIACLAGLEVCGVCGPTCDAVCTH